MQPKEFKEIKLNLFQEVDFELKGAESAILVLLCTVVFGASFFAGERVMGGYGEKATQVFHGESVLAAEDQREKNAAGAEENILPEEKKVSETMGGAANSVKSLVGRVARAKRIARQRAVNAARIQRGPVTTGTTNGLPDGRRVCALKNDHPQGGGRLHVDEDCCPDPNEWPNPRCAYSPGQRAIMK